MKLDHRLLKSGEPLEEYRPSRLTPGMVAVLIVALFWFAALFSGLVRLSPWVHLIAVGAGLILAVIVFVLATRGRVVILDDYLVVNSRMFAWQDIVQVDETCKAPSVQGPYGSGGATEPRYSHIIYVVENGIEYDIKLPRLNGSAVFRDELVRRLPKAVISASNFADWIDTA
jgi:hypothetical protein